MDAIAALSPGTIVAVAAFAGVALATIGALIARRVERRRARDTLATALAEADLRHAVARAALDERLQGAERQLDDVRDAHGALRTQAERWRDALDLARDERAQYAERAQRVEGLERQVAELTERLQRALAERATLAGQLDAERTAAGEKLRVLVEARDALTHQFRTLADDILEEKSRRFAEQNASSLGALLEPLKQRIGEFRTKVEEVYVQEGKDRSALAEQVRQLMALNRSLSEDARHLADALKGSAKAQGQWGELILERLLEAAGLQRGREYVVQDSRVREDGTRAQPDVVLHLPGERRLVIDAKVSLVAYERHASAGDDGARAAALSQHLDSVRAHVRGLSERNYPDLYGLKSIDFVLMFVPIEPAFMLAVTHDDELFMDAWQRNVLLVSPSTLLFVVRTVAYLWSQEARTRNAHEIARRGAELYDKFSGFVQNLQAVGTRLAQAQQEYELAMGKLTSGRGNLVRQAEMLRELGVKPTKVLPEALLEGCGDEAGALAGADAPRAEASRPEPTGDDAAVRAAMAAHPSHLPPTSLPSLPESPPQ